jgi:hypothetical protein
VSTVDAMREKISRLIPAEMRAAVCVPLPWEDEFGEWHEPAVGVLAVRISTTDHKVVNLLVSDSQTDVPDQIFAERVVKPALAVLERA